MLEITCVIPAHNEGAGICNTIVEIDLSVPKNSKMTIFVSEDGSKDNTRSEVMRASELVKNSEVVLSSPADRLGYSKAVQRGILECDTDIICFMDADGQCDPRDMQLLLPNLKKAGTVIVGYRNPRKDGYSRVIYSRMFGVVYRLLGGPKRIDPSSPFVLAYTSDIKYLGNVKCQLSFGFWWEFQWRIKAMGLDVIEIPVDHRIRSEGVTQVYTFRRLPKIVMSHLHGLWKLRNELKI